MINPAESLSYHIDKGTFHENFGMYLDAAEAHSIRFSHVACQRGSRCNFDDNQNELNSYRFYYDYNSRVGPADRPQAQDGFAPTVINATFFERERRSTSEENWHVKEYMFQTAENKGSRCATMQFTMARIFERSETKIIKPEPASKTEDK